MLSILSSRGRCGMDSGVSSPPGCQASSLEEDDAKWIRAYRPLRDVKHRLSKRTMRSGFERIVPSGRRSIVSWRGRCELDSMVSSPPWEDTWIIGSPAGFFLLYYLKILRQ